MARKQMYFGTKHDMQWVQCALADVDYGLIPYEAEVTLQNGQLFIRQTSQGFQTFIMNWAGEYSELRKVESYAHRRGPVYWLNPFAQRNEALLPIDWAEPGLMAEGWTSIGLKGNVSPTATPASPGALPTQGVTITDITGDTEAATDVPSIRKLFVPVPPGESLVLGWKGSATNVGLFYRPVQRDGTFGAEVGPISPITIGTDQLTNTTFTAGSTHTGIELYFRKTSNSDGALTAYQMSAALASTHLTGPWRRGLGTKAMKFSGGVGAVLHSAAQQQTGRASMTMTLKEVTQLWS